MPGFYQWDKGYLSLFFHLQPKASKNEFAGQHDERLKTRITAPPVDGKANAQQIKFIAQQFDAAKTRVSISSGESARYKTLRIERPKHWTESLGILPNPAPGQ